MADLSRRVTPDADLPRYTDLHRYETPETLYLACGLGQREKRALLALHPREQQPAWWAVHDRLVAGIGTGMVFTLLGRFGAGKTVLAAALLREACDRRLRGPRYVTVPQFIREMHRARGEDGEGEQAVLNRYGRAAVLVLDEADKRVGSDFEDRVLWELIDQRYKRELDTVLISNLSAEAFAKSVGGAVIDRIRECGEIIECGWGSFRERGAA